ncbi:MAG: alkaline phosphatase D family protein [Planctomycetaceae bacterium]|nr:alkaline phosphatase D family protein [Planctomycetaceae bacterium]
MTFRSLFGLWLLTFTTATWSQEDSSVVRSVSQTAALPSKIAFGSCAKETKPQPVLDVVVAQKPDLFIYLGDNIYGDTRDMNILWAKYAQLGAKPEFQRLRAAVPVLSIWDDHDFGENDAGKDYPFKAESREIFFEFWKVPADSPRRAHPGIYGAHVFTANGRTLQVILLDTRTFRDPLKRNPKPIPAGSPLKNDYEPDPTPEKTFLGATQWAWLGEQLRQPADVRIVASSIQFGHEYNGYESWTNLPREQQRFIDLIHSTKANGVVFISGDVHWAEISKRDIPNGYPLYDVTASGITETWPHVEANRYRIGEAVRENHFGQIVIDWTKPDPELSLQVIDKAGTLRRNERAPLSKLRFAAE